MVKKIGLRRHLVRYGIVGLAALVVSSLSAAVTLQGIARARAPVIAVQYGAGDALALAELTARTLPMVRSAEGIDDVESLARQSLSRSLVNPVAFRVLGEVAAYRGDNAGALERHLVAERLSRRDVETQTWLARREVGRGDWASALAHLDNALRVRRSSRRTVFPLLAAALQEPQVAEDMTELLLRDPPWRDMFLALAASRAAEPKVLSTIFNRLHDAGKPVPADVAAILIARLARERHFDLAAQHYRRATGRNSGATLRNGGFETPHAVAPFDWNFDRHRDAVVERVHQSGAEGNVALLVEWADGDEPELLRQMLALTPGAHRLTGRWFNEDLHRTPAPEWIVQCANGKQLGTARPQGPPGEWVSFSTDFVVPEGDCGYQWVVLTAPLGELDSHSTVYFDEIAVLPYGQERR